jgi:hypothetical protein
MVWEVVAGAMFGSARSEQERAAAQAIEEQRLQFERRQLEMLPYLGSAPLADALGLSRRIAPRCNCRNCGAPAEAFGAACTYCGSVAS